MSAQVDALKVAAAAEIANATALKAKLDAAIAANIALQSQLTDALANAADPADAAAIAQVTQDLADSTAINAPSN